MLNTVIKGCHTIEEFKAVRDRMEQLTAEMFQHHKRAVNDWSHGEPVKAWFDAKNNIGIEYADGRYWIYNEKGKWF